MVDIVTGRLSPIRRSVMHQGPQDDIVPELIRDSHVRGGRSYGEASLFHGLNLQRVYAVCSDFVPCRLLLLHLPVSNDDDVIYVGLTRIAAGNGAVRRRALAKAR